MSELIEFHTDLYRRDALELAAKKYQGRVRVELETSGAHVVARLQALAQGDDVRLLRDEFCTEAFSATVRRLRDLAGNTERGVERASVSNEPPWGLLQPFAEGSDVGLGWMVESLSPVRGGAAVLALRHPQHGVARVSIRRNGGAPLGVAYTEHLDFMLMNGGGGAAQTERSIGVALTTLANTLRARKAVSNDELLAMLMPHAEANRPEGVRPANGSAAAGASKQIDSRIDRDEGTISIDFDETGISRLAIYDAVLSFADRCYVFLTRPEAGRFGLRVRPRGEASPDVLSSLARDLGNALMQVARRGLGSSPATDTQAGLPPLAARSVDLETLLRELEAADPAALGIGLQPERGPGHEDMRILNIRGTGACNSECVFCIEKFNPTHRAMPKADATRQLILDSGGQYDMLFFASGEPTIHPKLFEYVELAKSVGFSSFGMSSHFRTFADPRFALKILQAGFEYFDISLHAADAATQLEVNPIEDGGNSLFEALKGLAVLYRLAEALSIRISVTQKIVVSRLNVTRLEKIFRATYDRGVRNFILQPVRTLGLAPELQAKLAISEDGILPHLNELLRKTEGLGAMVKPYGFSRQNLFAGSHVELEQNRVKNVYGRSRTGPQSRSMPAVQESRPTDGRHWVEVRVWPDDRFGFASTGKAPVLDDGLERGLDLPFGCRMGSCGMCCAKLVEGKVDQSTQIFLTEEQTQQGFVLMCQARPLSDVVLRVCTDDEIDEL